MPRIIIKDTDGRFTAEVRVKGDAGNALGDEKAEAVVSSALLLALASLVRGGEWPEHALAHMQDFLLVMRRELRGEQIH